MARTNRRFWCAILLLIGIGVVMGCQLGRGPKKSSANAETSKLQAEPEAAAQAAAGGEDGGFTITIEMLDHMVKDWIPGELGVLPKHPPVPADNPMTADKVELGKLLYFDPRLSRNGKISCATCHDPKHGWADGRVRSPKFGGGVLDRHSPTVLNAAYNEPQFWDGRVNRLEAQVVRPILSSAEMAMLSEKGVLDRLDAIPEYGERFQKVFNEPPSMDGIGKAIAAFERTIVANDSKFDRYCEGDKNAMTDQEKRGLILFFTKAACTDCHTGPNFTDNEYHNLGDAGDDPGRYNVSKDAKDKGAFRTATCRNVELTGPYMHNGALATLEDVVEFYNQGGGNGPNKSERLQKLNLTEAEKSALVAFLKSLTGVQPVVSVPELPKATRLISYSEEDGDDGH